MLHVRALSGEPLAELHLENLKLQESDGPAPVVVLKRFLGAQLGISRFCLKLMGDSTEIEDDTPLAGPAEFLLVRMEFQVSDGETVQAFLSACAEGPATEVQRLLEAPKDPQAREPGPKGCMGIHVAARHGHLDIVKLLLEAGSDKDELMLADLTVLHVAAANGHLDVVRFLLEARADQDASAIRGFKALHFAAHQNHADVLRMLLEAGTDKDVAKEDGSTALHISAQRGHSDVVQLLLEERADKEATTQAGATPLYEATQNGHWNVVRLLLEAGADQHSAIQDGRTLLQMAVRNGHLRLVRFLLYKMFQQLCKRRRAAWM